MEHLETFVVADNTFSVTVPDGLAAWEEIAPRYREFAAKQTAKPVLEIAVKVMPLAGHKGEMIYAPEPAGYGFITSTTWRLADGSIAMEFSHIDGKRLRLRLTMSDAMDRAEIAFEPVGDDCDSYFLTHALMLTYMLGTLGRGTLLAHSSAVIFGGKAYLFQGKSGTGKSTHASLWVNNIPGAELLNDDHPVIRFSSDGVATAYGSPWSGKTHCYRDLSAPIGAIVRIVRDKHNELRRLSPIKAYGSLTPSIFYLPFLSESLRATRHSIIERLVGAVSCCEMHCLPDDDAAHTCQRQLASLNNKIL